MTALFGLWGLVLLVFGVVAYVVTPAASTYTFLHVGLGFLLIVFYFTTSRDSLTTILGERSTKYGANAVVYSLIFVAVVVVVNWLAARHNLDKPSVVDACVEGGSVPHLQDLLDSYRYASDKLTFHMVDPDKERDLAERYHVTELPTVHIQYGDQTATVTRDVSEETLTNGLIKASRTSTIARRAASRA